MVHLWIHHRVSDYPHWKKVFDETLEWRREMGEAGVEGEPEALVFRQVDAGSVRPGS